MLRALILALGLTAWMGPSQAADPTPPPAAEPGLKGPELLPALIQHSRSQLLLQEGRLAGPGLAALRELLQPTQYLLLGEDHLIEGVADFATALWPELHALGYRHAVLEADPWSVAAMERALAPAADPLAALGPWLQAQGGAAALPFYGMAPEARWLATILRSQPGPKGPRLWGVDQVFLGSVPIVLEPVARQARDPQARRMAQALADEAKGNLNWLPKLAPERLHALLARLDAQREPDLSERVQALLDSRAIYQPFTGGGGEALLANEQREQGMRRAFFQALEAATRREGRAPKVVLKLGANHLSRGASSTGVQSFGNAVVEAASRARQRSLSMLLLCKPGSPTGTFQGGSAACDAARYQGDWAFLEPHLHSEGYTVFDLRSWRLRPGRWAHLPARVQQAVLGFDLLVFAPSQQAAQYLPGLTPPKVE